MAVANDRGEIEMARKSRRKAWELGSRKPQHKEVGEADQQFLLAAYQSMQNRLNAYRQNAFVVGAGVIAAMTAFDATVVQGTIRDVADEILVAAAVMILVATVVGLWVLTRFQAWFEELASIVELIDDRHSMFEVGHYFEGRALYPFGRSKDLSGWDDPMINTMRSIVFGLGLFHLAMFVYLLLQRFGMTWLVQGIEALFS